jgi:hypothetical protein
LIIQRPAAIFHANGMAGRYMLGWIRNSLACIQRNIKEITEIKGKCHPYMLPNAQNK